MAARAGLAYFESVLDTNWVEGADGDSPGVPGRDTAVPKPHIAIEGSADETRLTQAHEDLLFVRDGGPQRLTPRSFAWTEKKSVATYTLDIRTSVSRVRFEGGRDENNAAESYGGLRGEVERILDSIRTGDQEFDWIDGYEWNDLSADVGYGFWRGTWEVRTTTLASQIDPSTNP